MFSHMNKRKRPVENHTAVILNCVAAGWVYIVIEKIQKGSTEWLHFWSRHDIELGVLSQPPSGYCGFLQMNTQSKGKTSEARQKADTSDLQLFQNKLKDRIQLYEREKEMESSIMSKV